MGVSPAKLEDLDFGVANQNFCPQIKHKKNNIGPYLSIAALAIGSLLLTFNSARAAAGTNAATGDKVAYARNLDSIKKAVETLRGKKFLHDVPAFKVSEQEMRTIADRDLKKQYPGRELADYQAMLAWLDMVPPGTDLKAVETGLFVGDAAGFYDSDTKEMCIPLFSAAQTNGWQNPAQKTVKQEAEKYSTCGDDLIFAHEFTHALEDQYWPFDDPSESSRHESTDRGEARSFLAEGAATRLMLEAIPALWAQNTPEYYPPVWNVLHSGLIESVLDLTLGVLWKTSAADVPGMPETLARSQVTPYCYGYCFCSEVMRQWGLDGLERTDWIPLCALKPGILASPCRRRNPPARRPTRRCFASIRSSHGSRTRITSRNGRSGACCRGMTATASERRIA